MGGKGRKGTYQGVNGAAVPLCGAGWPLPDIAVTAGCDRSVVADVQERREAPPQGISGRRGARRATLA